METHRLMARYIFAWFVLRNALSSQLPIPRFPLGGMTAKGTW